MLWTVALLWACTGPAAQTEESGLLETGDTGVEWVIGPAGEHDRSVDIDGMERFFDLYVPESATAAMEEGPVPLLVVLHGAGDTGSNIIHAARLTDLAEDNGFVVVGPDGYNRGWFVQENEGWPGSDGNTSSVQNDLGFMSAIVDTVHAEYRLDTGAVFAVGHSRGAGMSALMAIGTGQIDVGDSPWTSPFAAYGVNAGYDPYGGGLAASGAQPKRPVWVIHGTSDGAVPFSLGQDLADSLDAAGFEVEFTRVTGGEHTWLWQAGYGQDNQDLWDWLLARRAE